MRDIVKHGLGNTIPEGCVLAPGKGSLEFIEGQLQELRIRNGYYIKQAVKSNHTAANVKMWFTYNRPQSLNTLIQSPDMSTREYLWDHLGNGYAEPQIKVNWNSSCWVHGGKY